MPPEEVSNRGKYEPIARAAAKSFGIDESLFVSLLNKENPSWNPLEPSFDKYGDGRPKSIGIGQITEETAKLLGIDPSKRSDPYTSIPASARLVSQLAKKYDNDWWKITAAYNAGEDAVDRNVKKAASANPVSFEGKDWRSYFAREHPDYARTVQYSSAIIDEALHGGTRGPEIQDFAAEARKKYGQGGSTAPKVSAGPPDLNDDRYVKQNDDGTFGRDYEQWAKDNAGFYQGQKLQRDLEEGPQAQYYDDVVKEISANIASGQYGLSKAKTELDTRKSVYETIIGNAANLLQYAVPEGSSYFPGGEPGGFYSQMGVPSTRPVTQKVDPWGMGQDLINQTQSRLAQVPDISSDPVTSAFNNLYPDRPITRPGMAPPPGPLANSSGGVQWQNPFESGENVMQQALPGYNAPGAAPTNLFADALDIFRRSQGR